jgi:hypothetical protein
MRPSLLVACSLSGAGGFLAGLFFAAATSGSLADVKAENDRLRADLTAAGQRAPSTNADRLKEALLVDMLLQSRDKTVALFTICAAFSNVPNPIDPRDVLLEYRPDWYDPKFGRAQFGTVLAELYDAGFLPGQRIGTTRERGQWRVVRRWDATTDFDTETFRISEFLWRVRWPSGLVETPAVEILRADRSVYKTAYRGDLSNYCGVASLPGQFRLRIKGVPRAWVAVEEADSGPARSPALRDFLR